MRSMIYIAFSQSQLTYALLMQNLSAVTGDSSAVCFMLASWFIGVKCQPWVSVHVCVLDILLFPCYILSLMRAKAKDRGRAWRQQNNTGADAGKELGWRKCMLPEDGAFPEICWAVRLTEERAKTRLELVSNFPGNNNNNKSNIEW